MESDIIKDLENLANNEELENENLEELEKNSSSEQKIEEDVMKITSPLSGMYQNWFIDYASYVILERAVPLIDDGLKPVQRRILHSMYELEDGRYNKVANIIGNTMKYHPHGDASIGEAIIQLGQKNLLIDTQGNWGNIFTGDKAAAARYIEARLSKFALEVVFNPKITRWKLSYDGRNKEPIALPVKFPLLLVQGVEGIAVGLASKILPHNFIEVIDAAIDYLKGKDFELYPDFPTGGLADISKYNDGQRGGKVRIRARIVQEDKKTLVIKEIPYGETTISVIESIVAANEKGKIKIRKIDDNTSENVEIVLHLHPTVSPDITIDALYAFTKCEVAISPNTCVIENNRPKFLSIKEILKISTQKTVQLLKEELEIEKNELLEKHFFASLEKIFIEKEIYQKIKKCTTLEEIHETVYSELLPYTKEFYRQITDDDIKKLIQIPIVRISKYDSDRANELIKKLLVDLEEVENHLNHIVDYAINYFQQLKKKYSKGRERKTELRSFDVINASEVAVANQKLYVNREEGFIGTGLTKDEYVCDCSDLDDVIVFREDGKFIVTKVADKVFVGQKIIYAGVFKKNDDKTIYNMIYSDGASGISMVKRFAIGGITRDREYDLTSGKPHSKVLYFSANPNGETEIVRVFLKPRPKLKKKFFDFDFSSILVKGRNAKGNILSKYPINKIQLKELLQPNTVAQDIWFDENIKRLNTDGTGIYLGSFYPHNKILAIMKSGTFRTYAPELSTHFDDDMIIIKKYHPKLVVTAIYIEGDTQNYMIKRFNPQISEKRISFLPNIPGTKLIDISINQHPRIEYTYFNNKQKFTEILNVEEFIDIKSIKAKGKKLSIHKLNSVSFIEPLIPDEELLDEYLTKNSSDGHQDTDLISELNNIELPESSGIDINNQIQMTLNFDESLNTETDNSSN